jgi:hypothetical protein
MGTNFYYHTNECGHCKRSDVLHVSKRSGGWSFSFRGYRDQEDGSPDIVSRADWIKLFASKPGSLINEYGDVIEDPVVFLEGLVKPTKEQQEKEDSPEWRGHWSPWPDPDTEWHDSEGFRFYDGEFS